MKVYYDFIVEELLLKAKKTELIKFTEEVLGLKIPKANKKEVFYSEVLKDIQSKREKANFSQYIEYFNWNLTVDDIIHKVKIEDIYNALVTFNKKLGQLYYQKSQAKTSDEKKKLTKYIGRILDIRNMAILKLYETKKASLVGVVLVESECVRSKPIYVDTITGKELDINKFLLLPNMKYCRKPKKNKVIDINNFEIWKDYKKEFSKKVINKNYIISIKDKEYILPESCIIKSKRIKLDEVPIIIRETKPKIVMNVSVDEIEYKKSSYIIHKFLEKQLEYRSYERRQKIKIKRENIKKMEENIKRKAEKRAKIETVKKTNGYKIKNKIKFYNKDSSPKIDNG